MRICRHLVFTSCRPCAYLGFRCGVLQMPFGMGKKGQHGNDATHVGPAKKSTLATLASLSPALLLGFIGWGVTLAGLSALQHRCLGNTSGLAGQQIGAANVLGQYDANPQCSTLYRYSWWIWALETLVLGLFLLASFSFHFRRLSWLGLLIVVTVLVVDQTNRYISFRSLVTGSVQSAARVVFAGWLITAVADFLLIIAYGWILDERYGAGYTGSGRDINTANNNTYNQSNVPRSDIESGMTGPRATAGNKGPTGTTGAARAHEGGAILTGPTPERY